MDDLNKNLINTYRQEFLQEAKDTIEQISTEMLVLEANPDNDELLDSIFRGIHTIKGTAGVYEMQDISDFTHHLEEIFTALREKKITFSPELVDVVLSGIDHVALMLKQHESRGQATSNPELVEKFRSFLSSDQETSVARQAGAQKTAEYAEKATSNGKRHLDDLVLSFPEPALSSFQKAFADGLNIYRIRLLYTSEMLENGYDPLILLKNLRESATTYYAKTPIEAIPVISDFEPLQLYLKPTVFIATNLSSEEIAELSFDPDLIDIQDLTSPGDASSEGVVEIDQASVQDFIESVVEWLESAERQVINYEQNNSLKALNEIFRIAHNIKGDAAYLGLLELKTFSHAFEALLERLRSGELAKTANIIDVILKSLDFIKKCVSNLAKSKPLPDLPPVFRTLQEYHSNIRRTTRPIIKESFLLEVPAEFRDVLSNQLLQYKAILATNSDEPISDKKRENILRALRKLLNTARFVQHPTLQQITEKALKELKNQSQAKFSQAVEELVHYIDDLEEEPSLLGEILVSEGKVDKDDLSQVLSKQKRIGEMLVEAGMVSQDDLNQALEKQHEIKAQAAEKEEKATEPEIRTMRIDEQKIEHFTNIVGEMLIARNTYTFLLNELESANGNTKEVIKTLKENLHLFARLTNDLQHGVISLRMIPIKGIFQKFNRVVRDISRKQKKVIVLQTEGDDIEIDKKVADVLSDPMVHLVRNACDHGLETQEERMQIGKAEKGTITLRASREGGNLCIRVIDDGRGIDRERLFQKAINAGYEFKSKDDPELLDMVFMPGLSTKTEVSEISGRGVGMDVVKTTIKSLGGTVKINSTENRGTEVKLSLPTTMGIETVLFLESEGRPYAISLDYVVETLKLPLKALRAAGKQMMFHHRGEVLMARPLQSLLHASTNGSTCDLRNSQKTEIPIVIIKSPSGKYGLVVDRLERNLEVAIKPVPPELAHIDVISGVSIMGDGKVLLILNPEKL